MNIETKRMGGHIVESKQIDQNGIPVGIVKGYIATWDVDRGNDKFLPGAFLEHLQELKNIDRAVRLKDHHGRTVGKFPIETVREDQRGLYGEGEINLEVQQGKELFSLVRQKALTDFSVGYSPDEVEFRNDTRIILKSKVYEGSVVDEPMNLAANITEIKRVNPRGNLPKQFADREKRWEAARANTRVKQWADATEEPNKKFQKAFLWWDSDNEENFTAYKLQIADIVDGALKIVPRAVFAVRAVLSGARGGVDIPESDQAKIKKIVNTLYQEMDLEAPFTKEEPKAFSKTEIKGLSRSIYESTIQNCKLSRDAASYVTSLSYPAIGTPEADDNGEVLKELLYSLKQVKRGL
jgi:HK97 family phage prohead protease